MLELAGVTDAVTKARMSVDALLANRVLRRRSADVSAESSMRGAWASAWLDGAELSYEDVRAGTPDALADPILQGALRAQAAIATAADTWTRAPRQTMARLHALAAADLVVDPSELGRPDRAAADRLDTLAGVLAETSVPAIVVSAIVHGELLSLRAFPPAAGVVARAAARLVLIERGLDPTSLVVLEVGHRDLADQYLNAVEAYQSGTVSGIAHWLVHCAEAVNRGANEALSICATIG